MAQGHPHHLDLARPSRLVKGHVLSLVASGIRANQTAEGNARLGHPCPGSASARANAAGGEEGILKSKRASRERAGDHDGGHDDDEEKEAEY